MGVVGLAMEGGFFGGNLIWQVMAAYKGLKREDNSLVNCKIWIRGVQPGLKIPPSPYTS